MYSFNEQYNIGKKAEKQARKYLEEDFVVDGEKLEVNEAPLKYQRLGIDFFVSYIDPHDVFRVTTIEVKADTIAHETGNIFWETKSPDGTKGCLLKSKARWLYYDVVNQGIVYLFPLPELRSFIRSNVLQYFCHKKIVHNTFGKGEGYAIPLKKIEHLAVKIYGKQSKQGKAERVENQTALRACRLSSDYSSDPLAMGT